MVDRKIRYRLEPKTNMALKALRKQLNSLLAAQFRGIGLTETQTIWNSVGISILSKVKPSEEPERKQDIVTLVRNQHS